MLSGKKYLFLCKKFLSNSPHLSANKLCSATLNDSFAYLITAVGNFLLEMQKFLWSYFILEWTCRVQQILVLASMKICRLLERMLTEDLWVVNPLLALEWRFIGDPETGIGTGSIFACTPQLHVKQCGQIWLHRAVTCVQMTGYLMCCYWDW